MGYLEDIIKKAYSSIKENPYIVLPATLIWIPSSLLGIIFFLGIKKISENYNLLSIIESFESDPKILFYSLENIAHNHIVYFFAVIIVIVLLHYYIMATYTLIAKALYRDERVSISKALCESKNRIFALVMTDILMLFLILVTIAVMGIVLYISMPLGLIGVGLMLIIDIVLFFMGVIYLGPVYVVLGSIVVLNKKSGFGAIKEAYMLIKGNILDSWLLVLVVIVISSIYLFVVSLVVGLLSLLIGSYSSLLQAVLSIFLLVFGCICNTLFYFYLKEKIDESVF
ncbi:MAG: hypothetical protein KAR87_00445 [Candidatus Aenigmarchaeota archaeon]|nr:hypothetical protein [Candidatus Aenigmarchaeota archaeon]